MRQIARRIAACRKHRSGSANEQHHTRIVQWKANKRVFHDVLVVFSDRKKKLDSGMKFTVLLLQETNFSGIVQMLNMWKNIEYRLQLCEVHVFHLSEHSRHSPNSCVLCGTHSLWTIPSRDVLHTLPTVPLQIQRRSHCHPEGRGVQDWNIVTFKVLPAPCMTFPPALGQLVVEAVIEILTWQRLDDFVDSILEFRNRGELMSSQLLLDCWEQPEIAWCQVWRIWRMSNSVHLSPSSLSLWDLPCDLEHCLTVAGRSYSATGLGICT